MPGFRLHAAIDILLQQEPHESGNEKRRPDREQESEQAADGDLGHDRKRQEGPKGAGGFIQKRKFFESEGHPADVENAR